MRDAGNRSRAAEQEGTTARRENRLLRALLFSIYDQHVAKKSKVEAVDVWPRVFAQDLVGELSDDFTQACLADLRRLGMVVGSASDSCAVQLVYGLACPHLRVASLEELRNVFERVGDGPNAAVLARKVRLRSDPDFFEVVEADHWSPQPFRELSDGRLKAVTKAESAADCPRLPVYTMRLHVGLPVAAHAPVAQPGGDRAIRPYGCSSSDQQVEQLSKTLALQMVGLPGAASRMNSEGGVLFPICAAAATLESALGHRVFRVGRTRVPRMKTEALEACLDALHLGPHRETLRRVVLRSHPEHIPIDTRAIPDAWVLPEWGGHLGLFCTSADGLHRTRDISGKPVGTRVLWSLTAPEPL